MKRSVRFLGEIALRVRDFDTARDFYRDTVGLETLEEGDGYAFFRVGEAIEGHPQLLVLFDREVEVVPATSTLDHVAFIIDLSEYEPELRRLQDLGVEVRTKTFPHFQWRSIFFFDPEGNTLEFVSYDPNMEGDG